MQLGLARLWLRLGSKGAWGRIAAALCPSDGVAEKTGISQMSYCKQLCRSIPQCLKVLPLSLLFSVSLLHLFIAIAPSPTTASQMDASIALASRFLQCVISCISPSSICLLKE